MIKRELYMRRIRPFMGNELIKVSKRNCWLSALTAASLFPSILRI